MSRDWDYAVPGVRFWDLAADVMKPGAHLVSFGGTRTSHRLVTAIEDAGFEIRESLLWLYGSGFPKSHNVGKAIDKMAGAEREVIGNYTVSGTAAKDGRQGRASVMAEGESSIGMTRDLVITAPATDAAKQWDGFGTALKPSHEPICLARKPFRGTVAANVMEHGTGSLNIDASRIGTTRNVPASHSKSVSTIGAVGISGKRLPHELDSNIGRWPANVLLDEESAEALDAMTGNRPGCKSPSSATPESKYRPGQGGYQRQGPIYGDNGGASRFFPVLPIDDPDTLRFKYQAKASRRERGEGNIHPTCKPIALMEWLITLITPPSGVVLDPFMGSGSTLVAAARLGVSAIGIEMSEEYAEIAARRIDAALDDRENAVNQQELLMRAGG